MSHGVNKKRVIREKEIGMMRLESSYQSGRPSLPILGKFKLLDSNYQAFCFVQSTTLLGKTCAQHS